MVGYMLYNSIYSMIILGAGIIPFSKVNNQLLFLLGKDIAHGKWSDFGGKSEKGETHLETAAREGYEELNGFLGSKETLEKQLVKNRYPILKTDDMRHSCYMMEINYSEQLPMYMNNNIDFIHKNAPTIPDNYANGLYEKSIIKWFTREELVNFTEFREYFTEIVWKVDKKYNKILHQDD